MELLKFFIKDEVPAVGLTKFKAKKDKNSTYQPLKLQLRRPAFKPDYSNNFFLL